MKKAMILAMVLLTACEADPTTNSPGTITGIKWTQTEQNNVWHAFLKSVHYSTAGSPATLEISADGRTGKYHENVGACSDDRYYDLDVTVSGSALKFESGDYVGVYPDCLNFASKPPSWDFSGNFQATDTTLVLTATDGTVYEFTK